ncbi:hypothetical protein HCN44_005536 [Aphidius gifuensis]|uniref:Geranylgeranyl transferase type-2 subunit alpha n=1 Tax=Aphidius gifuensis TaxID=684658 RepID=A0A835CUQ8_APHGI|nr:geranylgeranyl transferase type-2 subunit alpha [Aphidius gifuensis]KAF7997259.1 hypothetical protein HCN44_005536 [Aphidius gifuensis]
MHGRVKVRTTAEQEAIKKIERAKKVVLYKAALNIVFQKRNDKIFDDELFMTSEQMLLQNPDIATVWNIRREAIISNDWKDEEFTKKMADELYLTERCLRENPKSYSAWHHRCWIMDKLPESDWKNELLFCGKCLDLDERNFHCWDYRRYLVEKTCIPDAEELEFSTTKIYKNFSNYSSWHYRSKILSKMCPDKSGDLPIDSETHKEELDLVMNAIFTDPNDSSAFFYQRWLLDYSKSQSNKLWRAKITNKKAIIIFHDDTSIDDNKPLIISNDIEIPATWYTNNNKKYSKLWIAKFENEQNEFDKLIIKINNDTFELEPTNNSWYYYSKYSLVDKHNKEQLKEQMDSYQELTKMEPNNKWAVLTGIFIMKNYDFIEYHDKILEDLSALIKIDKLRSNYYLDIRSKCIMDYKLHTIWQDEKIDKLNDTIDLSNLNMTIIYNEHYLSLFEDVNLSGNDLGNSLHRLETLEECKKLSLSNNNLKSIKKLQKLNNIEVILLNDNQLTNQDELITLINNNKNIIKIDLRGNPICNDDKIVENLIESFRNIEILV